MLKKCSFNVNNTNDVNDSNLVLRNNILKLFIQLVKNDNSNSISYIKYFFEDQKNAKVPFISYMDDELTKELEAEINKTHPNTAKSIIFLLDPIIGWALLSAAVYFIGFSAIVALVVVPLVLLFYKNQKTNKFFKGLFDSSISIIVSGVKWLKALVASTNQVKSSLTGKANDATDSKIGSLVDKDSGFAKAIIENNINKYYAFGSVVNAIEDVLLKRFEFKNAGAVEYLNNYIFHILM